ncbi:MAG: protein-export membrane protein SecD [Candidatus Levybacteria bacterium RIFCSPHIGHO2_01_FULL_36_15]|nr:MAG: protein-export membrane protein SecD [Candidatus Levybacteria bacterium RIFCSPHIGHO2_01_FULL_36_15]OGH38436.1 MAG: protein-export membrane protein SecD [Candidatus Levybacteria bacterium RIFCSPLOWO2_01_FULL_36_10]
MPFINKKIAISEFLINPQDLNINLGIARIQKNIGYRLGLDLQGGVRLVYKVDMENIPKNERPNAFESARNIIERRINFFGVVEPTIQTLKISEDYRVIVELPGITNVDEATSLIGKTAQLSFWEEGATGSATTKIATPSSGLPFGVDYVLGAGAKKTDLTGKDLQNTKVVFDPNTGKPQVQLSFTNDGSKKFADITKRNVGKPVAIVLDNQVIEAPRVNEPILTGSAVITGSFAVAQAKSLSIALNAGALPAPLQIISQSNVGPSLGMESLKKSLFAGLVGFVSIVIFMTVLYKKEGILASIALIMYVILTLFIFKFIPVTLTLAGIAGLILSVGMAVDANILIFERMKEELRSGKPRDIAVENGFKRAWTSIRDSNISSLITSFILYYFGSGIVRGFAFTLAIGILISMFSAITITRNLLRIFDRK